MEFVYIMYCHFTVLDEFEKQVIMQLSRWQSGLGVPARMQVAGSIPGGDTYFSF